MGTGGKAGGKVEVTDYRLSIHYRICHGPIDALLGIYVGEKEAWTGEIAAETDIVINRPDLFGGPKKEGGVAGVARFLPGGPSQVMPEHLASRLGLTSATCPGYRGMASLFFAGSSGSSDFFGQTFTYGAQGFLWASNNPYLKTIWMKIRRKPRGLNQSIALIGPDANPAHIIYECLTNQDWGQGGAPSGINTASFQAAAQTLFNEGFGLSLMWTKQATIEAFVSEILDHIQATLFVNPRDGLMTIKLIRDDYDIDDLPILNADNCKVIEFDRKAWGETINEIVVTWTNPENEKEETVAAQNNANIAVQGGIISDSRNYYGVRNAELAQELAFRDLAQSSAPLAVFKINVDRTAWDFVPGGCARLQYPEYGIDDVVVRLTDINYGKPGAPTIELSVIEDIFSISRADYDTADGTQWEDPSVDPAAPAYSRLITAPAYLVTQALPSSQATAEYPSVFAAALVSQNNDDTFAYDLYGEATLANGDPVAELIGTRPTIGHSILPTPLAAEASTLLPSFGTSVGGAGPRPGGFAIIGNVSERGQEIAMIDSFGETGWTLVRGALDTVPRAWPDGTVVWFVSTDTNIIVDSTVYSDAETARFKIAPYTSRGVLPLSEAPILAAALTGRPHLPLRPANVVAGGAAFGSVDLSGSLPATVTVTWANRNRTLEDNQVLAWADSTVVPEAGQTTTIKVISTAGTVLTTHSGLTGTSFAVPAASFGGENVADIAVYAERDGLESFQSHRVRVKIRPGGWGDDWGNNWGSGGTDSPIGDPEPEPVPADPEPGTGFPSRAPWYPGVNIP
jgi:hypothetical protein